MRKLLLTIFAIAGVCALSAQTPKHIEWYLNTKRTNKYLESGVYHASRGKGTIEFVGRNSHRPIFSIPCRAIRYYSRLCFRVSRRQALEGCYANRQKWGKLPINHSKTLTSNSLAHNPPWEGYQKWQSACAPASLRQGCNKEFAIRKHLRTSA